MANPIVATTILIEDRNDRLAKPWDFIPEKTKLIRFDTIDILIIAPFFVQKDHGYIFGCYGGTAANPTGDLTTQFEYIVRTARLANPNVKIIAEQFYGSDADYTKLDSPDKIKKYTDSVAHFLNLWQHKTYKDPASGKTVSLRIDGYDVDYEWTTDDQSNSGNQQPWAPEVLSQIRTKVDALKASPKFLVSVTPATTACLEGSDKNLYKVLDYVIMQNYDGGAGTTANHYLQAIPGIKPSQLLFGISAEVVSKNLDSVRSMDDAINSFKTEYTGTTETGPLGGLFIWRLNSDNWVFENMTVVALYSKINNIPAPDGMGESVDRGLEDNGTSRRDPYTQQVWVNMDEYRVPS